MPLLALVSKDTFKARFSPCFSVCAEVVLSPPEVRRSSQLGTRQMAPLRRPASSCWCVAGSRRWSSCAAACGRALPKCGYKLRANPAPALQMTWVNHRQDMQPSSPTNHRELSKGSSPLLLTGLCHGQRPDLSVWSLGSAVGQSSGSGSGASCLSRSAEAPALGENSPFLAGHGFGAESALPSCCSAPSQW